MRLKQVLFALVATLAMLFTGCVYQNNSSPLPETGSIKLTVKIKKNKLSNPDLALKEYDYVKFWFFDKQNPKKIKSVLATKLSETNTDFDGQFNFKKQKWVGANTNIVVETDVDADLIETDIEEYQIDGVPVGTEFMAIGIPDADGQDSVEVQFIKINQGVVKVSENISKYGEQYDGLDITWNTNLIKGKVLELGDKDNPVVLIPKGNKQFIARLVPQMVGKNSIGQSFVTGPFNGWNNQDAAYEMTKNEDGIYEFIFNGKSPGEFIYKFGYDGAWGDADITGDKFVDDNNGGNNSKAIVNGEASSKFLPVISLISNKRAKGSKGVTISSLPSPDANYNANWDNLGVLKVEVNTDLYLDETITLNTLVDRQVGLGNTPTGENGQLTYDNQIEVWEATNPGIKSVSISYDGKLDSNGNPIATTNFTLKNEPMNKYIYKKEYQDPFGNEFKRYEHFYLLENIDIPTDAGIYQFTVTAIDKNDMQAQELVFMQVVNTAPVIVKTTVKSSIIGPEGSESILNVFTVKVSDIDTDDIAKVALDLTMFGQGEFQLVDDGTSTTTGDAKAGDNIYTNIVMLSMPLGEVKYEIPAQITDKSGVVTEQIITINIDATFKAAEINDPANLETLIIKGGKLGVPTKLIVFDGRNVSGVTTDMSIEIMGSLNGWAGGDAWVMDQVAEKVWIKVVRLEEGSYDYKFRTFGDWGSNWNSAGEAGGANDTLTVIDTDALPSKLLVFDGREAAGVTADMTIEIMGSLNGWAGGADWIMTPIGDKVWAYLAHLEEGTYEYKYRTFGDWGSNWNSEGESGGANNTLIVTETDGLIGELLVFYAPEAVGLEDTMNLEVMGSLNSWAGGSDWQMSKAGSMAWVYLTHLEEGSYEYKFRTFGDWGANWNKAGESGGDNNTLTITELTQ